MLHRYVQGGVRRLVKWLFQLLIGHEDAPSTPLYKIGNVKYHNSIVDSLLPQLVEIGDNFISAPGSIILAHDASLFVHSGSYRCQKTVIGNNVFVGANAVILPGVRIGDGAIVGAGSVITKDVEPYTVVAGNPARHLCTVDEYVDKCRKRGYLYTAPLSFQKIWEDRRLTADDIGSFQKIVADACGWFGKSRHE